ncbi:MAG: SMC-Scp complex subunit ScpB [Planctomycetota bacterium]
MQGRKGSRRIERLTDAIDASIESSDLAPINSEEGEITLEDLGNAYAAVLQWKSDGGLTPNLAPTQDHTLVDAPSVDTSAESVRIHPRDGDANPPSVLFDRSKIAISDPDRVSDALVSDPAFDETMSMPVESDGVLIDLCSIIEAVLFVGMQDSQAISKRALIDLLRDFNELELDEAVRQLNVSFRDHDSALEIGTDGDGYIMRITESMIPVLESLQSPVREAQLSQSAIDCLSLIAYQPGITKNALESQWGQTAGAILNNLIKRGLVRTSETTEKEGGIAEAFELDLTEQSGSPWPGYFTTERFLEILGLDSLDDLPRGDEL